MKISDYVCPNHSDFLPHSPFPEHTLSSQPAPQVLPFKSDISFQAQLASNLSETFPVFPVRINLTSSSFPFGSPVALLGSPVT